jgi:signal peptidase II
LMRWLRKLQPDEGWTALGLSLVIAGALGNLVDRAQYGYVIDFLDFHAVGWHWPAFNLADSAIFVGVIALLWASLVLKEGTARG